MQIKINKEKLDKFLDFLAWMALASIVAWALAKGFGWINTPAFVEVYPMIAAAFFGGRAFQKMETLEWRMGRVENEIGEVKDDIHKVKDDIHRMDKRLIRAEAGTFI